MRVTEPLTSFLGQTKLRAVEEYLRKKITSGEYPAGMKLSADQDLAREFGVAYMTVRHAMEPLAREGLVIRTRGKGTFVADLPATQTTKRTLTLVVPSISTMWNVGDIYYLPGIIQAFCAETTRLGYEPSIVGGATTSGVDRACAGAAVLLANVGDYSAIDAIAQSRLPVVSIHAYRGRRSVTMVHVRQAEGVQAIVAHLAALGHRRIAYIGGPENNLAAASRLDGFRAGLRDAGLSREFHGCEAGEYTDASGYQRALGLIECKTAPTAIVTASDLIAAGVVQAAKERSLRVPEDLSVVGFGDFYIATMVDPPLTTARLPLAEMGKSAARELAGLVSGDASGAGVQLETELIVRASTAPPIR